MHSNSSSEDFEKNIFDLIEDTVVKLSEDN